MVPEGGGSGGAARPPPWPQVTFEIHIYIYIYIYTYTYTGAAGHLRNTITFINPQAGACDIIHYIITCQSYSRV